MAAGEISASRLGEVRRGSKLEQGRSTSSKIGGSTGSARGRATQQVLGWLRPRCAHSCPRLVLPGSASYYNGDDSR